MVPGSKTERISKEIEAWSTHPEALKAITVTLWVDVKPEVVYVLEVLRA